MDHRLICTWLGLGADCWPPDHYRLLGLEPGEADAERIEREVHERLAIVRCYQLAQQEEATEAMNRLAQAFVCLTDPDAKRAYDARLRGAPPPVPDEAPAPKDPGTGLKEPVGQQDLLDELPPATLGSTRASPGPRARPERLAARTDLPALPTEPPYTPEEVLAEGSPDGPPGSRPSNGKVAPSVLLGIPEIPDGPPSWLRDSAIVPPQPALPARRSRGTKRTLYRRIAQTRQLARAWEEIGQFLSKPATRVHRPSEATQLIRQAATITTLVNSFPSPLGDAGQPGYLVLMLTRQATVVPAFQTLQPGQRESLARDWRAGQKVLAAHRDFLRYEVRNLRWRRHGAWIMGAGRLLIERPGLLLMLVGLLALNIALWGNFVNH